MDQSTYFTLDLASGFLHLTIHEADRHLTAFRDVEGKLWEYVRCDLDLKPVPLALANYVNDSIMEVKKKVFSQLALRHHHFNPHLREQLELLHEIRQSKLSVNLPKSEFGYSVVEWLGIIIDRFGIRSAPSKIEAITQLSQASTLGELRVLRLGMVGYIRKFVPNYSWVLPPILTSFVTHAFAARNLGA